MIDPGFTIPVGLSCLGGLIWAIRLEGRVNGQELIQAERNRTANERHEEVLKRFDRLEGKIDLL